jgi:cytochrome c oxidase assembly factor CtaG
MGALEHIPAALRAVFVILFFAAVTVGGLYAVRRKVPAQILREEHDVAGFAFGVIGSFYGVVLAFVIVAVWQRFERATEKVQDETVAIANLYTLSQGLGEPMKVPASQPPPRGAFISNGP